MMVFGSLRIVLTVAVVVTASGMARADYWSHPDLRPHRDSPSKGRCDDIPPGIGSPSDPGGAASLHCQRLFWDIPVVTELGTVAVGAPYDEDPIPRFPNGITDRIPPMFVGNRTSDGVKDGFERLSDCQANATNCLRLCADPLDIPYWAEVNDASGQQVVGSDGFGKHAVRANPTDPLVAQTGLLFSVECIRGSRSYYGPWQTGGAVDPVACKNSPGSDTDALAGACKNPVFDRVAATQPIRFENTDRLDAAVAAGSPRVEWNIGSEFYNHFGSHHGTCSQPIETCGDPTNPQPKEAYEQPDGSCAGYTCGSYPGSSCYSGDGDPRCVDNADPPCADDRPPMGGFRNATQLPGRLSVPIPDGRGVLGVEDQMWGCNHHVVTQLPPGSYGMDLLANYRLQTHGVKNEHPADTIWDVPPGAHYGGTVGEMIIQYPVKAATEPVKPVNVMFNAAGDAATTYYPPFTWQYHESEWTPPFDAAIALTAIHSHHRMVKGTMNVAPGPPVEVLRPNATNPDCGARRPDGIPADLYTDWFWEDAPVCEYWKEEDGPVVLRKGQSLRTTCYVNNGVTPEAIKHGLVAGAAVEALKALGAPIPDYPELVPASTWGDALVSSPVGQELLYGKHPPINYRVVYKCSERIKPIQVGDTTIPGVPGATLVQLPFAAGNLYDICSPNPNFDADDDYIDGAYVNNEVCGGGLCEPSSIVFACIGEDEMCIGVAMYWALPRLGSDRHDEAMANLQEGNVNEVGTPGNVGTETDISGICTECQPGL